MSPGKDFSFEENKMSAGEVFFEEGLTNLYAGKYKEAEESY
jgi:hypothetical protein